MHCRPVVLSRFSVPRTASVAPTASSTLRTPVNNHLQRQGIKHQSSIAAAVPNRVTAVSALRAVESAKAAGQQRHNCSGSSLVRDATAALQLVKRSCWGFQTPLLPAPRVTRHKSAPVTCLGNMADGLVRSKSTKATANDADSADFLSTPTNTLAPADYIQSIVPKAAPTDDALIPNTPPTKASKKRAPRPPRPRTAVGTDPGSTPPASSTPSDVPQLDQRDDQQVKPAGKKHSRGRKPQQAQHQGSDDGAPAEKESTDQAMAAAASDPGSNIAGAPPTKPKRAARSRKQQAATYSDGPTTGDAPMQTRDANTSGDPGSVSLASTDVQNADIAATTTKRKRASSSRKQQASASGNDAASTESTEGGSEEGPKPGVCGSCSRGFVCAASCSVTVCMEYIIVCDEPSPVSVIWLSKRLAATYSILGTVGRG